MAARLIKVILALAVAAVVPPAAAQTVEQTFVLGGTAPKVQIAGDQKLMLEAANKLLRREYRAAEALYTQAIALNRGNIEAYLQRAVARRESGDQPGMASDAQSVIALANNALQQNPSGAEIYYQRGMGYRLLRQFDQAASDIATGIRVGGRDNWKIDLKAIELERKTPPTQAPIR